MQNIAILGGTFNPVHLGHLLIAETALQQYKLEQVLWVPTYYPPHKTGQKLLSFTHRLAMLELAIADHAGFTIVPLEAQRSESMFAIQTFQELQWLYPKTEWFWIVGLDALQTLPRWPGSSELAAQCSWLVAPRQSQALGTELLTEPPTNRINQLVQQIAAQVTLRPPQRFRWQVLKMPLLKISSSLVRQACRDRQSIRALVPESVRLYIQSHQLYVEDED
jgi:nicotinate-nucleotide adenylyltransferase